MAKNKQNYFINKYYKILLYLYKKGKDKRVYLKELKKLFKKDNNEIINHLRYLSKNKFIWTGVDFQEKYVMLSTKGESLVQKNEELFKKMEELDKDPDFYNRLAEESRRNQTSVSKTHDLYEEEENDFESNTKQESYNSLISSTLDSLAEDLKEYSLEKVRTSFNDLKNKISKEKEYKAHNPLDYIPKDQYINMIGADENIINLAENKDKLDTPVPIGMAKEMNMIDEKLKKMENITDTFELRESVIDLINCIDGTNSNDIQILYTLKQRYGNLLLLNEVIDDKIDYLDFRSDKENPDITNNGDSKGILKDLESLLSNNRSVKKKSPLLSSKIYIHENDPESVLAFLRLYQFYLKTGVISNENKNKKYFDILLPYYSLFESFYLNRNNLDNVEIDVVKSIIRKIGGNSNRFDIDLNMERTYPLEKDSLFICDISDRVEFSYLYVGPSEVDYEVFKDSFEKLNNFIKRRNMILKINGEPIYPGINEGRHPKNKHGFVNENIVKIKEKYGKKTVFINSFFINSRLYLSDIVYIGNYLVNKYI